MKHLEIRKKFLDFFEQRGHKIASSSSLITDDPSVLLTTAGMQQFKPYFVGKKNALTDFGSLNTASVQKSFRTSDIEEVGDESHLTFFEMLGNFSFGGYFKDEAIKYAYDLLNSKFQIPNSKMSVTVFGGDDRVSLDIEAEKAWKELGFERKKGNLKLAGREDNFWGPTGLEGPCGPTTEIYINGVEIWNIVFNEYYCRPDGSFEKLETFGVDTGMGLERLAVVLQKKNNIFETDLFAPLLSIVRNPTSSSTRGGLPPVVGDRQVSDNSDKSERIIVDHLRGMVFLIADGLKSSNIGAGFILRRIIRQMVRHARLIGFDDWRIAVDWIISEYGLVYPELRGADVLAIFQEEKNKFEKALEKGIKEFQKIVKDKKVLRGEDVFYIYETFGFPIEIIKEMAAEQKIKIDEKGFKKAFEKHQNISRAGAEKKFGGHGLGAKQEGSFALNTGEIKAISEEETQKVIPLHTATHLFQQALRDVLGNEVRQRGSDINSERLRFDFSFIRKLTPEELKETETIVNQKISGDLMVKKEEMRFKDAVQSGALYVEGRKYPAVVDVYTILNKDGKAYSKEICGGPHVKTTGEIGEFKIIKEEASSAGVRRIKAIVEANK